MPTKNPKPKKERKNDIPIYSAATKVAVSDEAKEHLVGLVGYEGGNGKSGLVFLDKRGMLRRMVLPNARIRVTGDRVERSADQVTRIPYAQIGMEKWGYSDAIWHVPGRIDTFQGMQERYGSPEHVFPLLVMMAENGLPDGAYRLVVTVPPGYYNNVSERVAEGFQQGEVLTTNGKKEYTGRWTITLSKDDVKRSYSFPQVYVIMEAADAGFTAFRYDLEGNIVRKRGSDGFDYIGGRVRLIDMGFGTCDTPTIIKGTLLEDSLNRSSDGQGGILANIAQPVMNQVIDQIPETRDWITPSHVDYWLRRYVSGFTDADGNTVRGWTPEAGQVPVLGKILHLAPTFDNYSESYARYAWRKVIEASQEQSDVVLAIGGGWLYSINHVRRWYKDNTMAMQFFTHEDLPHLKNFSFVDINLVGIMIGTLVMVREGVI